jgi:putative ABC transport system permease protein
MPFKQVLVFYDKTSRSFILAVRSLWLHKLRAFLSVLGIIIGTAAVIALMAFGSGSMQEALDDIMRQGATNIIVRSVKPSDDSSSQRRNFLINYGLTYQDYERFHLINSVIGSVPMRIFPQEVRRLSRMVLGRVVATTPDYQNVNRIELVYGRFLVDGDEIESPGDDNNMRNVCVLGSDLAEILFPFQSALGETIVLNKHHYVVVGVLAERMPLGSGAAEENFNMDVYIPLRTCLGRFGEKIFIRTSGSRSGEQVELHQVTVTIADMAKVRAAGKVIEDQLETSHLKKDWSVSVPLDRLELAEQTSYRYMMLLFMITSISLLVGGIGIMNIMLATVTERTREIGIRRALGAKRRDIALQFLIEAIAQTTAGGFVGLLVGLAVALGVPIVVEHFGGHLASRLHVPSMYIAIGVDVIVGVAFGLYPAVRAAYLDPIEALRHE